MARFAVSVASWLLLLLPSTLVHGFSVTVNHHSRSPTGMRLQSTTEEGTFSTTTTRVELPGLDPQELLSTAETAARAAGRIIAQHVGCSNEASDNEAVRKTNIKDVVTQYDKQAQEAVEAVVRAVYPNHAFLGEEDVAAGSAASEAALVDMLRKLETDDDESKYLWIVDPIDGTANFAQGLRQCAVTMAVVHPDGRTVLGLVYDPHTDEMFTTLRGQGHVLLNGHPVIQDNGGRGVNLGVTSLDQAVINAGCPADPAAFATSLRGIAALNSNCRGLRMMACSALTLAWISTGRLSAHFGYDLSSWDLAAGALLIAEAGGKVTDLDGSDYKLETRNMLCSNGLVHDEILEILEQADAVKFTRTSVE